MDGTKPKKLNFFTSIKFLSKYLKGHRLQFFAFYIGWLGDTVANIVSPIIFGLMINQIVYYNNIYVFVRLAIVFVVIAIFSCLMYYFCYQMYAYNWVMFGLKIKRDVLRHLHNADAQYMSDINTGNLVATVQWDPDEGMHFIVRNIIHNINSVLRVIFCTLYIYIIDWRIGVLISICVPIAVIVSIKFGKKIRRYGEEKRKRYGVYIGWLYEMLSGLKDIRFLGAERKTNKEFVKNHKKMFDVNIKSGISTMTSQNIIDGVNMIIQMVMFSAIAVLSVQSNITIGLIIIITTYYAQLTSGVKYLSKNYMDAQERIAYIQHVYDFMHAPSEIDWKGRNELEITEGNIRFVNIEFAYNEGNKVLDNFSVEINSGERFALVGNSGCGKTTLAYMLIGFYRPQCGYIEIDGQKLTDCSLKSIRENIGIIQQDVLIFDGTIKENLLLCRPNATDAEIMLACRRAEIEEFIMTLSEGIDTVVGTKGVGLSGGQKQRIAIARIYLKDPKIIIFDEATSSLDSETEEQIHKAWGMVLAGRTSIVIAHRLSSVMLCEKVAMIEEGKLCEIGEPTNMIKNSMKFKTLFAVKEDRTDV